MNDCFRTGVVALFCFMALGIARAADLATIGPCVALADAGPCLVAQTQPWGGRMPAAGASALVDADKIVISWVGEAKSVRITGEISQLSDMPVVAPGVWQLVIQYRQAAALRLGLSMMVTTAEGKPSMARVEVAGPAAAPPGPSMGAPQHVIAFEPEDLSARVWLPPGYRQGERYPIVYEGDGGSHGPGSLLSEQIRKGLLPPVIVVGVDDCPAKNPRPMCRAENYLDRPGLPMASPEHYAAHEQFLITKVIPRIESQFGKPRDVSMRAIAGASNSAVWAASMALRHPDLFGRAIVMSPGMPPGTPVGDKPAAHFVVSAGELERGFAVAGRCIASAVLKQGGKASFVTYPAGHSRWMWHAQFVAAVTDWLAPQGAQPAFAPLSDAGCERYR